MPYYRVFRGKWHNLLAIISSYKASPEYFLVAKWHWVYCILILSFQKYQMDYFVFLHFSLFVTYNWKYSWKYKENCRKDSCEIDEEINIFIDSLIFCFEKCPSVWATIEAQTHFQSLDKKILEMGGSTEYFLIFL